MTSSQDMMELGQTLITHCSEGRYEELWADHYAEQIVSSEAVAMPDGVRDSIGIEAVRAKNAWWSSAHDVHSSQIDGPFVYGDNRFSLIFTMDVTHKESGQRSVMKEIATYHADQSGRICREEFAYAV